MTQVLLFNQYFTSPLETPEIIIGTLPINLLYVASYAKNKGIDCKIYELGIFTPEKIIVSDNRYRCGISDIEIVEIIKRECPKIIGLGCMYSRHYIDILSISKLIKNVDPSIKVVLGGNHASSFDEMVLKHDAIDFVVRGEGEITFYELCNAILREESFEKIRGITYKENNAKIKKTSDRELIENLDGLPMDYSLIDVKKYVELSRNAPYLMRSPAIGIISSRGCPGKCVYCTVKAVWGRGWRGKSAQKTVDEIEFLHRKYDIQEFGFLDDSASLNKKRWNGICEEIIKRKLNIRWTTPNGIAHWTLDNLILEKMKKAGCYRVTFGIESGNIETRNFLGKPYSLSQAAEMIRYANKIGMWTICTNILGSPNETRESMNDTIRFAKKSGTDFAAFYLLSPQVTSDIYNYYKKEGLLDFDYVFNEKTFDIEKYEEMNKIIHDGGAPSKYFTSEELKKIQIHAYRSFVIYRAFTYIINPFNLLRKIRSFEDFRYVIKNGLTGFRIFVKTFYKKTTKSLLYD